MKVVWGDLLKGRHEGIHLWFTRNQRDRVSNIWQRVHEYHPWSSAGGLSRRGDSIESLSVNSIVNIFEVHELLVYNIELVNIRFHAAFRALSKQNINQ